MITALEMLYNWRESEANGRRQKLLDKIIKRVEREYNDNVKHADEVLKFLDEVDSTKEKILAECDNIDKLQKSRIDKVIGVHKDFVEKLKETIGI